jgi:hypothetical protein
MTRTKNNHEGREAHEGKHGNSYEKLRALRVLRGWLFFMVGFFRGWLSSWLAPIVAEAVHGSV